MGHLPPLPSTAQPNRTLDGDEHLEKTGFARPPLCPLKHTAPWSLPLTPTPSPCTSPGCRHSTHLSNPGAQEADTHLPIVVQVGVQAATALGEVAEVGGHGRVDVRELNVKQVEPIFIGGSSGALDEG